MAFVVHFHDDEVLAILQLVGDVIVEGCEPTNVVSHVIAVHIDVSIVIYRTEVEQRTPFRLFEL